MLFHDTFEHAAVGIAHVALDGRWLRINHRLADIVGYTTDELLDRTFQDITDPADLAEDLNRMQQLLRGEHTRYSMDKRYVRRDGSLVWVHLTVSLVRDVAGEPAYFIAVVEDIDARKRAEELAYVAAGAQGRLAAIVESSHDAIVGKTLEGIVTSWNAAAERILGWTAEEMIGRSILTVIPPELHHEEPEILARIARGERIASFETTRLRKDGTRLRASLTISPVRDATGRIIGASKILRDITAQREAEAAERFLAEASARLAQSLDVETTLRELAQLAIETLADGSMVTLRDEEAESRGEYPFVHVSAASRVPGRAELVLEMNRRFPFPVDAPTGYPRAIRTGESELVPEGAFEEGVLPLVASGPEHLDMLRQLEMRSGLVAPLVARGRTLGALTLVRHGPDRRPSFTERDVRVAVELGRRAGIALDNARLFHEAERARAEAEEARALAEGANRAKSAFLATMSHELRTPLNAIGGYAELLEMGIRGPVTPEQREDLHRIRRSQKHLLGLINEVLNYARIESGSVHYDIASVEIAPAISAVEALILPQVQAKGLELTVHACDDAPPVRADAEKLRQILLNLLSNAVKFTGAGGTVEVSCRPVHGDAIDVVEIAVRDTGIGIPSDQLEHIFEPFVQVGRGLNTQGEGTGLGLSISRDLARGMGGDLTVESAPGAGSIFALTLPRAE